MRSLSLLLLSTLISVSCALQCFQCNSGSIGQSDCSSTDVSVLKSKKWAKSCGTLSEGEFKGKPAKGCRKIEQYVGQESQIIRECAYSGEEVDGQKKTGNWGIQLYYYQCKGELCNGSSMTSFLAALGVVAVALGFRN